MSSYSIAIDNPQRGFRGLLLSVVLLAIAWFLFFLTVRDAHQLAEQWGSAPDVYDALVRDQSVAKKVHSGYRIVVILDIASAWILLFDRARIGWQLFLKVTIIVLGSISLQIHALCQFVNGFFAS